MPSGRQLGSEATRARGMPPIRLDVSSLAKAMAPPSNAQLCERAVRAIWRSLDEHDLVDHQVRRDLATVLEPLTALGFEDRPQRLINILRLPDPIDPAHLYWLTRRLLTLVPELQAAALAFHQPSDTGDCRRQP